MFYVLVVIYVLVKCVVVVAVAIDVLVALVNGFVVVVLVLHQDILRWLPLLLLLLSG